MILFREHKELEKKYVKKLFRRPHKARCKKCDKRMFLVPEDKNPGRIIFRCTNCDNIVDVSDYKDKYVLNRKKLSNFYNTDLDALGDARNLSRTIIRPRFQDKYYSIDDKTIYNPVSRTKCTGHKKEVVDDDEHKQLLATITLSML